jgi:hypothetical protein
LVLFVETVHRNVDVVNNAWRACSFLVGGELIKRLETGAR